MKPENELTPLERERLLRACEHHARPKSHESRRRELMLGLCWWAVIFSAGACVIMAIIEKCAK